MSSTLTTAHDLCSLYLTLKQRQHLSLDDDEDLNSMMALGSTPMFLLQTALPALFS